MDISLLSMNLSQMKVQESAQISLLKMNLENQSEEQKFLGEMMDSVPELNHLGNQIDTYV